jgi:hypothetical protein
VSVTAEATRCSFHRAGARRAVGVGLQRVVRERSTSALPVNAVVPRRIRARAINSPSPAKPTSVTKNACWAMRFSIWQSGVLISSTSADHWVRGLLSDRRSPRSWEEILELMADRCAATALPGPRGHDAP